MLDVTTWCEIAKQKSVDSKEKTGVGEVLVGFGPVLGPTHEGAGHHAAVDEIEFLGVGPWFFDIVDFEGDVWWKAGYVRPGGSLDLSAGLTIEAELD